MIRLFLFFILLASPPLLANEYCQAVMAKMDRALGAHQIFAETAGSPENPQAIVLIPGLDSAVPTFGTIMEPLGQSHYVLAYDQRGHGRTADEGEDFSSELMAADLYKLVEARGLKRFHLLGHSMGARTATRFAAAFPERVASLIIEDMILEKRSGIISEADLNRARSIKQNLPRIYPTREALANAIKPIYGNEAESLSIRRARKNSDGTFELLFRPHVSILYGTQANSEDLVPAFRSIKNPTLVMYPEADGVVEDSDAERMEKMRTNVTATKIPRSNHVIHRANTRDFMRELETYLQMNPVKP
jgi:esterase